jgi:phosphoribosylglycinamide formyltransferase-1
MGGKIKIGALVSGGGSNLQSIIDACESGSVHGEMVFVGADNPTAGGLSRAQKHGIPTFVVDYTEIIDKYQEDPLGFPSPDGFDLKATLGRQSLFGQGDDPRKVEAFLITRAAAESLLLTHMGAFPFDLLVLAGFMRKLSPYIIDRLEKDPVRPCIMNIHPALLPAFPGTDGYGDTLRYGCKVGGCTVHFVDYGEDSGPIIGQRAFAIEPDDTLDSVKAKGLKLEWALYPACIQLYAQNRLTVAEEPVTGPGGVTGKRRVVKIK